MQTTSPRFSQLATGHVRPLSWAFRASFDKQFDSDVTFFTLDTSVLDGIDVLASDSGDVITEWDKYSYADYSDRVMQVEWQREESVPFSVNLAMCDIVLNNYDGFFNYGSSSPLGEFMLPRRPVRVLAGFGGEVIPQFVGLTDSPPKVDKGALTATLHAEDFLSYLFNKPLDQTVIYENMRTDEVLAELFELFGVLPGQYNFDEGQNTIPFVYFEVDTKLGDAVRELMEAEMGRLYMDELGIIQFRNRVRQNEDPVATFDASNIIDYKLSETSDIINVVEVKADVRQVQPTQNIFSLSFSPEDPVILNGGTTEHFFKFDDPVTTIETITEYIANSSPDGTGSDETGNITVTDVDLFSTSVKVTFSNSGATACLTTLELYGTPAKIIKSIDLREQNDASVEKFEEQPYSIDNNFIQSNFDAMSLATALLSYFSDYNNTINMEVKGSPAYQVGDTVHVTVDDIDSDFVITKLSNGLENSPKFSQRITARVFNIAQFFTLDESVLDGEDVLAV